jgi:hypothetical protein
VIPHQRLNSNLRELHRDPPGRSFIPEFFNDAFV